MLNLIFVEGCYMRNGVGGAPFFMLHFVVTEQDVERSLTGIVFEEKDHVAVFEEGKPVTKGNAYRGDCYETALRNMIKEHFGECFLTVDGVEKEY